MAVTALFSLASCGGNFNPDSPPVPAQEKNTILLRLGSFPLSVQTKAHERGVNYNENLIESVDLFFYPEGGTGSNAVIKALGRGVEAKAEADSIVYAVSVHYTEAQATALFGGVTDGATCQVYAVANASLTYGADTKVETLKNTVIERDFSMSEIQNSFLMSSVGTSTVTLAVDSEGSSASGRVPVKRAAAKAQLFLNLPESLSDPANSNRIWKPDVAKAHYSNGVYVDLVNLSKKGKIDGDYTLAEADYIDSEAHSVDSLNLFPSIVPALDDGYAEYKFTSNPFYSYPVSWFDIDERECVYLIHIPWYAVDGGEENPSARSEYRTYQVSANVVDLKFERNHCYRTFVNIQSLGGAADEQTVIIPECDYWICPWNSGSTAGDGLLTGSFSDYKYLVIDNPVITLNNEEIARFNYISSSSIVSVRIDTLYYYDNSQASPRQKLHRGMTGANLTAFNNAVAQLETPDYTSTPGVVALEHKLSKTLGRYGQWEVVATITNNDGISEMVRFIQNPSIRLERSANAGNVFVNGFFAWVTSDPGFGTTHSPYKNYHSTLVTFPTTAWHCHSGWYTSNYLQYVDYTTGDVRSYNRVAGGSGNMSESIDRNFFITIINISSFNEGNSTYSSGGEAIEYCIGDPRVKASTVYNGSSAWTSVSNFYKYMTGETSSGGSYTPTGSAWENPGDILITSQDASMQNIIAPKFLVSSALNANTGLTFDDAVKRAATYQEAGYPAGRWRLPTEAEMAFIVARQNDGTIPTLYATGSPYWSGSGRLLTPSTGGSISFSDDDGSTHPQRFVYDLWYWGDTASTTNVYHPNGHIYDYDASGAATLR